MPVEFEFDPFDFYGIEKPEKKADQREALDQVAELIHTSVLDAVGSSKSPLKGYGKFRGLSKEYKKFKQSEGAGTSPNLELNGDLLDALRVMRSGSNIKMKVLKKQDPKADGHNNHSGESSLPLRRFIPKADDGDEFNRGIESDIKAILRSFK